jgi:MacB-like periplasmic core domain
MLNTLKTGLRALLRKSEIERELDEELRHHIEQQTEQNIRLGMNPEEARYAALKSFGGVEQAKERSRDARGVRWIEDLWHDLRYGARMLLKNPGFTLIAVLTLALGIGANTAIFSVVNAVLLKPLPYRNAERLIARQERAWMPMPVFDEWRSVNQACDSIAGYYPRDFNLTDFVGGGEAEYIEGIEVSAEFFRMLQVGPALGRTFTGADFQPGSGKTVILSHSLWQRRFNRDQNVR